MAMAAWLSKTDFTTGLQCALALWLRKHAPEEAGTPGRAQQLRFEYGNRVDAYAREVYPGGVIINEPGVRASAETTHAAIVAGATRIYQATVTTAWGGCMADILDREPDGTWTLREVKMTTVPKAIHLRDVAFQTLAFRAAGLDVQRALIVHVDSTIAAPAPRHSPPDAPWDAPRGFLREVDVTADVERLLPVVRDEIATLHAVVDGPEPRVRVGQHCDAPYPCAFKRRCWTDVPRASVFTIPGIGRERLDAMLDAGTWAVRDVPLSARLPKAMRAYVQLHHDGPSVNLLRLRAWLASLLSPLRFIAFVAERSPLPRHDGVRPYEAVPVLLSCHTLHADGSMDRIVHLHPDARDPAPGIAEALTAATGVRGHVLSYDAAFVRGLIPTLIGAAPEHAASLSRLRDRLRDMREIVEGSVRHPEFLGSYALEDVVPVLLGGDKEVLSAAAAQADYASYVATHAADERHRLAGQLYAHGWAAASALVSLHWWAVAQAERSGDPGDGWVPLDSGRT